MIKNYNEVLHENETLDAGRIILRRFRKEDASDLLEYASDEETLQSVILEGVNTTDAALASIFDYCLSRPGIFAIELQESKKCIGNIDIRLDPENDKGDWTQPQ